MKILKKIFNANTGYFIKNHTYYYDGKPHVGYIVCRGYVMFGITGYDKVDIFVEKNEADEFINKLDKIKCLHSHN
jgi:hypothetical protein